MAVSKNLNHRRKIAEEIVLFQLSPALTNPGSPSMPITQFKTY